MGWIIAGIGALVGGISAGMSSYYNMKAQNEQINNQITQLEKQDNYLKNQYNNSVKWTNYQFGQNSGQLNQNMALTAKNRDLTANVNAYTMAAQNKQDETQLAATVAQYEAQKGSVNQSIASSGFRKSEGTSYEKYSDIVRTEADKAISDAFDTYDLSSTQRYLSARMSYIQSGRDIESYQNQLAQVQAQYNYSLRTQKEEYDYNHEQISDNIKYLKDSRYDGWEMGLMIGLSSLTGAAQGTVTFGNAYTELTKK